MQQNTNPIDKSNMRQVILDGPKQFEAGLSLAKPIIFDKEFSSITVSGMGGSSLPVDVLNVYVDDLLNKGGKNIKKFKVFQNRYYVLPPEAYENSLNVISSYSGNTEETITAFEEALSNNLPCIGISSGGKIEKICQEKGVPFVKLPGGIEPRMAVGYFFGALFQILVNAGMIEDETEEIISAANKIKEKSQKLEEKGIEIAKKIVGKIPVVYANVKYKAIAMIWKIKLNENGKVPAFWNYFPELNHNEINGFANTNGGFFAIMLRDNDDNQKNLKRYDATRQVYGNKGIESDIIDLEGTSTLEKIFFSLHLGDWVSYYLALENDQDPTPVDMVEEFKKLL
jgi:glucose/mannose-6-phosphate isomerase